MPNDGDRHTDHARNIDVRWSSHFGKWVPSATWAADGTVLVNPWHPMTDPVDLKTLGKFLEELGECTAAASRCVIQGVDEAEPVTGKINREWLQEEIADILAGADLTIERFKLDREAIATRCARKMLALYRWHVMA